MNDMDETTKTDIIPAAPAIVLDTNVCLDLFVFADPRWASLMEALDSGQVRAITRADCRDEYRAVLHYRHLPLDESTRPLAAERFDCYIAVVAPNAKPVRLPVCTDRDDQKFMELARDAGAAVLVTKDKALLKLAKKVSQAGLFRIVLPEVWVKEHLAAASARIAG
jgi:predicted nucleic acid-binding protein